MIVPTACLKGLLVVYAVLPVSSLNSQFNNAAFTSRATRNSQVVRPTTLYSVSSSADSEGKKDNKAMAFLKKIGKVGGAANRDFRFAVGVDEGPSGKTVGDGKGGLKKQARAFKSCIETGILDDMSEVFPTTASGTRWDGYTDKIMGGMSDGNLAREEYGGRMCNVMRGHVSLANNGGFIQMATNLVRGGLGDGIVDASRFEGVELDVNNGCQTEKGSQEFNVNLKTTACLRPFSSYQATFEAPYNEWTTVRIPFSQFEGQGPGAEEASFDASVLQRLGIVAVGKEMSVKLAISGVRFY